MSCTISREGEQVIEVQAVYESGDLVKRQRARTVAEAREVADAWLRVALRQGFTTLSHAPAVAAPASAPSSSHLARTRDARLAPPSVIRWRLKSRTNPARILACAIKRQADRFLVSVSTPDGEISLWARMRTLPRCHELAAAWREALSATDAYDEVGAA